MPCPSPSPPPPPSSSVSVENLLRMADPLYTVASDAEAPIDLAPFLSPLADLAVGVDFGTSHCSLAVWTDGCLEVLADAQGVTRLPSCVFFNGAGGGVRTVRTDQELLSGSAIYNIKRLVGRMDTDPVVQMSKNYPFLVRTMDIGVRPFVAAFANDVWRSTTPEEVLAISLVELKTMAEKQLRRMVRSVVLTMPVSFSRFQQTRLGRACAMAGLHVLRLLPESTAVALLYAQQQQQANLCNMGSGIEKVVLIFNMGAGYCDVSVASTAGGVSQIKALAGDSIGGEDLIQNVINHLLSEIGPSPPKDSADVSAYALQLRAPVERAMQTLSSHTSATIEGEIGGKKVSRTITRDEFEQINDRIFQRCEALVLQCLQDAQVDVDNLADLILAGGCSIIPRVRFLVQNACGGKQAYEGIDPLEAAARGAALEGAIASGMEDPSGKLDLLTIQAIPRSLGIRIVGNEFLPILHRNVTIPARRDVTLTTTNDSQTDALIVVYEGEARQANENHLLGFFKLSGIPAAPKGLPIINVCVDVDASDVMRVLAGVYMPDAEKPVVPLLEVRMPTVDDGHGWCTEAILNKYGSVLDIGLLS